MEILLHLTPLKYVTIDDFNSLCLRFEILMCFDNRLSGELCYICILCQETSHFTNQCVLKVHSSFFSSFCWFFYSFLQYFFDIWWIKQTILTYHNFLYQTNKQNSKTNICNRINKKRWNLLIVTENLSDIIWKQCKKNTQMITPSLIRMFSYVLSRLTGLWTVKKILKILSSIKLNSAFDYAQGKKKVSNKLFFEIPNM